MVDKAQITTQIALAVVILETVAVLAVTQLVVTTFLVVGLADMQVKEVMGYLITNRETLVLVVAVVLVR
jgi:hypothetical protein